jgi:hypothetical protein
MAIGQMPAQKKRKHREALSCPMFSGGEKNSFNNIIPAIGSTPGTL